MACYFIIEVMKVKDETCYRQYAEAARKIVEGRQGEYVIRSSNIKPMTGKVTPARMLLIRFPSEEALHACFNSPEYRQLTPLREQAVESQTYIVNQ